jgi:peptide/nickel transport system ATP-binding protein/oligopeptide transport system ATP-binding protein
VAELADDVAVMYGGKIVERGVVHDIFERPAHPYTRALVGSARDNRLAVPKSRFDAIPGTPPLGAFPPGCPFHPRCTYAMAICRTSEPAPRPVSDVHACACHLVERVA